MRMTTIKKKTGYALGLSLCIIGIIMLLITVWKLWDTGVFSNQDTFSALQASLSTEYADIALGIGLKPIHYTVFGALFLAIGSAILIARREKVTVTEEATVLLECPSCKTDDRNPCLKHILHPWAILVCEHFPDEDVPSALNSSAQK